MKQRFFLDNNLSPYLGQILGLFDRYCEVVHLTTHFPGEKPDVEWIPAIASWKPRTILISADKKITSRPNEAKILYGNDLSAVFLKNWNGTKKHPMNYKKQVWHLLRMWEEIRNSFKGESRTIILADVVNYSIKDIT